ncbi:MAG: FG-GAP repeat protein [Planctomycetes bacterium]|nr:FG-GAP repeat protein [Planctomycetota bacterium]
MFTRWLRPLPSGRSRRNAPAHPRQRVARLVVEALEDRYVPSTLTVTSALDDGSAGTLRAVVNAAAAGDVITFDPLLNGQTITLTQGEINIAEDLTVQGPGASLLSISGNNASRIFNVEGPKVVNVAISGLTVTGGNGTDATTPTSSPPADQPTAGDSGTIGNATDPKTTPPPARPPTVGGGAIRSNNANLTLIDLTVTDNHADGAPGGGILDQAGTLIVRDSTVSNNSAGTAGGGIFSGSGTLTIVNTTLSGNMAGSDGGGLADNTSALTLQRSTLSSNTAGGKGGGVALNVPAGVVFVSTTTGSGNPAKDDGGGQDGGIPVHVPPGAVLVDATTISGNTARGDGGGLFTGAASPANFTIKGSFFTANKTSAGRGGGLALVLNAPGGSVALLHSIVAGNSAPTQGGGGILLDGTASSGGVVIGQSSLVHNQAGDGTGDDGGGLLVNNAGGSVTVEESTIAGNSAADSGGGIFEHHTAGSFVVLNSTITSNNAGVSGGGLQVDSVATLTQLESTIIANNAAVSAGTDLVNAGSIIAANNNLVQNGVTGSAPGSETGNLIGQDPLLGLLRANGGPTPTQVPLPGSPVLDKGSNPRGFATDQRGVGFTRTIGEQTDIGAVEVDPNVPSASLDNAPPIDASSPPGPYDFQVRFDDHRGIRVDSLGAAVRVTGPNEFDQVATLLSVDSTTDDPHHVATYSVTPPDGVWTDTADGTYTISIEPDTARNLDGIPVPFGPIGTFTVDLTVQGPSAAPSPKQFFAVGQDAFVSPQLRVLTSSPTPRSRAVSAGPLPVPQVRVYDAATGALEWEFDAYPNTPVGGVRVAVADMDRDGTPDIITAPGPGPNSIPLVKIWSGATHTLLGSLLPYAPGFHGGVFVAVGDVTGDGISDLVTGAGAGAGPHVKVFNGIDLAELYSFFAFDSKYTGGVHVAAGDVNGDGRADLIVGAATVGHVRVFSGADGSILASFMAYGPSFLGGVFVAAGDLSGNGHADIITGTDAGGQGQVRVFSGSDGSLQSSFFAFGWAYTGGVHVGTADVNGDGKPDILVGSSHSAGPHLKALDGLTLVPVDSFWALPQSSVGIFVS